MGACLTRYSGWKKKIFLIWYISFIFSLRPSIKNEHIGLAETYIKTSFSCEKNIYHIHFMPLVSNMLPYSKYLFKFLKQKKLQWCFVDRILKSGLISCWNKKQNTKSYLPANKYRGLRGYKSSYLFLYPLGFFILRMARHYFPLLSVNLLSVKPVLNP